MDLLVLLFLLVGLSTAVHAEISSTIGINYGQLGNDLPSHAQSIKLIQNLKAGRVKLYDANPEILRYLSDSNIQVSVMVPNQAIANISFSQSMANDWIRTNILPFYPKTRIRTILVGNEILTDYGNNQTWFQLVPAMRNIKRSLTANKIKKIKVGTPLAMDILQSSFPPSNGTFRSDVSEKVMKPMLHFLNKTNSFFFIDIYPYFAWAANPTTIDLDYALFRSNLTVTDAASGLVYTNLLDQQLDALIAAMNKLGFPNIRLSIAETGWPNGGDLDQIGCNIYNAAEYNRNLVRKMVAKPPLGTPARPNKVIPTYIFSLYNENQKPGQGTERHWGLLYPNGSEVYEVDLTGETDDSEYNNSKLPAPTNNSPYKGKIWCVAASTNASALAPALAYACGQGNGTCAPIQAGKDCFKPNTVVSHANYAFNLYWQQFRFSGGNCFFGGLAVQTTMDPSYGSCKYPTASIQ